MTNSKLYVGNLSFQTLEIELDELFQQAGKVSEAVLMQDRTTGQSRGFGFVTMGSPEEARKAVDMFHGKELGGRALTVNEARPREERAPGGGGQRRFGGGGGNGGGRREYSRY